jgi:hypothetical protein
MLVFLGLCVLGFFAYRARIRNHPVAPAETRVTSSKATEPDSLENEIGIKRVELSGNSVTIGVNPLGRCGPGDLDAINIDLRHSSPKARVLFSLEPFDPSDNFPASVHETNLMELSRGTPQRFDLPNKKIALMGLYVCKDSDQTGYCRNKRMGDINEVFNYDVPGHRNVPQVTPDRVYFFQFLVRAGNNLLVIGKENLGAFEYNGLRRILGHLMPGDARGLADITKKIQRVNGTIVSLPMQVQGNEAFAVIPRADNSFCPRRAH